MFLINQMSIQYSMIVSLQTFWICINCYSQWITLYLCESNKICIVIDYFFSCYKQVGDCICEIKNECCLL